jgi:hypothetical protein
MRLILLFLLLPLFGLGSGCTKHTVEPLVKPGTYQDSPEELKRLWSDILLACQKDDRARVHELMASFVMTKEEFLTLVGKAQGEALWPRYLAMLGSVVNAGAVELVAHIYEKKYDDIAVHRIDVLPAAEKVDSDRNAELAMLKAGAGPRPFYTVRVKRKTETRGLRYDFFVYTNGYWRSGNLIGKFLPPAVNPAPPETVPGTAVSDPKTPPIAVPEAVPPVPKPAQPPTVDSPPVPPT